MMGVDYEDMLLNGFESVDLRRENAVLRRRLQAAETRLLANPVANGSKGVKAERERADKYERLYRATLARCEILNRKVRELNG
jgi:regulator of replication initiation timing